MSPFQASRMEGFLRGQLRPWRELALLTQIGMELCWIALWYSNLTQINQPVPIWQAYLVLGGLLLASHALARLLRLETRLLPLRRLVDLVGLVLGCWIGLELLLYLPQWVGPAAIAGRVAAAFAEKNSIPPEFWVLLVCLLVWYRGIATARMLVSAERTLASFGLGILMLALYGATLAFLPVGSVFAVLYAFLTLGLISLSAARIYQTGRRRGGRLPGFNRTWLVGITATAALVVGIGIIPASLLPDGVAQFVIRYLVIGVGFLAALAILVLTPVVILLLFAIQRLAPYFSHIFDFLQLTQLFRMLRSLTPSNNLDNLIGQVTTAKPATLWGILAVVVILILAGLSWKTRVERSAKQEAGKLTLSTPDLLRLLGAFLMGRMRRAAHRFRGRRWMGSAGQLLAAARVRWIYARLLRLCARLGNPRPPASTPLEFLSKMEELLPEHTSALEEITQAYVRVRYGEAPETAPEIERLQAHWNAISRSAAARKRPKSQLGGV
jgi:hypothetical protein